MLSKRIKNYLLYKEKLPIPNSCTFEITNACNYSCFFCAHSKMTRPITFMKFENGKKYLHDLYESGIKELGFNGCGESMLHKDIAKFVNYAKKLGFKYCYITSNGSFSDDNRFIDVLNAGIDSIKFSINASNSIDYAKIHKTSEEMFYEVIRRENMLAEYINKNNLPTKIYASCASTNENDIENLKKILHIDEIVHYKLGKQAGQNDIKTTPKTFCNIPFHTTHITPEGYINVCCSDFQHFLVVGDLNTEKFLSIWNGELYEKVRKQFLAQDYTGLLCNNCFSSEHKKAEPLIKSIANYPQL